MSDATRRAFLAVAGSGAAAAAAVAAAPGALAATPSSVRLSGSEPTAARDPLVAYVADPRSGRITVMHGEHEVTVHDAELVRRLARIAGR
jgi:hypothetical protein